MKTLFTKTDIYEKLQNMAINYIQEHPEYVFARGSYSGAEFVLIPKKAFRNQTSFDPDNIYFSFVERYDYSAYREYELKVYKQEYIRKSNTYKYDYIYRSEGYYLLDNISNTYTTDLNVIIEARKVREDRYNKRNTYPIHRDRLYNLKEVKNIDINNKLIKKIEKFTDTHLKNQTLKYHKDRNSDGTIRYIVLYIYRNKLHAFDLSAIHID